MDEESKGFAKEIFKEPSRKSYAESVIKNLKISFETKSEYDHTVITNMKEYKLLMKEKLLYGITRRAYELAKEIQNKSGNYRVHMNFLSGKQKDDIELAFKFSPIGFLLTYPYAQKQRSAAVQAVFSRKQQENEDKWYQALISGATIGRYQYNSENGGSNSFILEKHWDKFWLRFDSIFKVKYSTRWLDVNAKEQCWTKQFKLIRDFNKESELFKYMQGAPSSNYLYAKLSHKSRTNLIDTDRCTGELLRSGLYPDSLWSLKLGHKNSYETPGFYFNFKSSGELAYNKTDSPFLKFRSYFQYYYDFLNQGWFLLNNSLLFEKVISNGAVRPNDAIFLRGIKGFYEFPGAKTCREAIVETGKEHIGDRVGNDFMIQYEAKLYFPSLSPFRYNRLSWLNLAPYLYGTVGYAKPQDSKYAGSKLQDNIRGSTGFGLAIISTPIAIDFFYSVEAFKPKSDLGKEFGFYIGIT